MTRAREGQDMTTADFDVLDDKSEQGLKQLFEKVTPLLESKRFDNIVDLISLVSDSIDMFDEAMLQKLMKLYEEGMGTAWSMSNAVRLAANKASTQPPPSVFDLLKRARQDDVRRGLHFTINFLAILGQQMRAEDEE